MASAAAEAAVLGLVEVWLQNSLLDYSAGDGRFSTPPHTISIEICGVRARLGFSSEPLAHLVVPYVSHLQTKAEPEIDFELHECGGVVHLFKESRHVSLLRSRQALPVIQRHLTEAIIGRLGSEIVLHAASLVKNGRALLISGRPGAGKTTLSLALEEAAFKFGGDDIAILDRTGGIRGVPFAPAVKAGSWPLVETFRSDLRTNPIHRRLDGRRIRYVKPRRYAPAKSHPVKAIVFLVRRGSGDPALEPLEPIKAISNLIGGAFAADHQMTVPRLKALVGCVTQAGLYRLSYSRLDEAVALLERMWHA
jgi:energy-coupling factor transporter ATP-binding protein EcfA2